MARFLLPLALLLAVSQAVPLEAEAKAKAAGNETQNIIYSLPGNVLPINYDITLVPTLHGAFGYTGKSIITVKVLEATKSIVMHSKDLDYEKVTISVDNNTIEVVPKPDPKDEEEEKRRDFLTLEVNKEIAKDKEVKITLEYSGVLNDDLRGFYRSSYINEKQQKRWLATTHFEATSARRAFPCFDEPALKATFDITIDLKDLKDKTGYHAISNTPVITPQIGTVFKFKQTPKMSSYLVAFVVSDFEEKPLSANKRKYSVWTKKDLLADTDYALNTGKAILEKMETYVGVPYQLEKMDQVGIPDFAAGAMENWGIVTYRQNSLVHNSKSTAMKKQGVASIIAHEFAHQWFGNHVGPAWWQYIWLNEGFATFFQYFITDEVETEFKMREQFVVKNLQGSAFIFDVTDKSRPMNADVKSPTEIAKVFDTISYDKSACVIRMMQHFLTEKIFKDGLKKYLDTKINNAANSDDLFKILNDVWNIKDQDMTKIMNTWVTQPGYPVITVERDYDKKTAKVVQQRFLLQKPKDPSKEKWTIPINFATGEKPDDDFKTTNAIAWFAADKDKLDVELKVESKHWVIFNKQQTGYYRVNYDEKNWRLIIDYLTKAENVVKMNNLNRAQLVDDAWNLARASLLNYKIAFDLTNYLTEETDFFPWYSAIRNLKFLKTQLTNTQHFELFRKFGLKISSKLIQDVGFQEGEKDDHIKKLKRSLAVEWACSLGHENCTKEYGKMFNSWVEDAKKNPIKPNLQSIVICVGLERASQSIWEKAYKIYQETQDRSEKDVILNSLGCSRDEKILVKYLDDVMKTDSKSHDFSTALQSVYNGNEIGWNVSMKYIFDNIVGILKIDKGDQKNLLRYINDIGKKITKQEQLNTLKDHLELHKSLDEKETNSAINSAKENIAWVEKYSSTIGNLLVEKTKENSASPLKFATLFCLIPIVLALFI